MVLKNNGEFENMREIVIEQFEFVCFFYFN